LTWAWRHIALVFQLAHHLHTASPAVKRVPDLQQDAFSISSPLVIPEPQHLDILRFENSLSREVELALARQAMLETIELNA